MDFRSRGTQPPSTPTGASSASSSSSLGGNRLGKQGIGKWLDRSSAILLFSITILILAITGLAIFGGEGQGQSIKKDKYQAVFLNNGQVYFGNIRSLNNKYVNLQNIYYLQTGNANGEETTTNTNVSLVKLGCELHAPYDQMVINSDQVLFWENLKDDSQVVKAIAQYKKDNPNGQTCNPASQNSTQQAPSSSTQPNTTSPTTNTNSSTTTNSSTRRP